MVAESIRYYGFEATYAELRLCQCLGIQNKLAVFLDLDQTMVHCVTLAELKDMVHELVQVGNLPSLQSANVTEWTRT